MTKANTQVIAKIAAIAAGLTLVVTAFALSASSAHAAFDMNLTIGSTGSDVTALQTWLIGKGFAIPAGATGYFGAQTQAALAKYQASVGISPAVGYFGPITRAKVNAAGGSTSGGDDDNNDDNSGDLEGGEADLSDFDINDEEASGAEGEEDVDVFTVDFDVDDGDVEIDRMDILASSSTSSLEDNPWDFFDAVHVMDADGDELVSMDVDSRDDWDEEDGQGSDQYSLSLNGLDYVVREGDEAQMTVSFDIASNIDTADLAQDFDFSIADDGIRARDGEGIDHYIPNNESDTVDFTFDTEETGDLDINTSSDDPDNLTIISDDNDESDEYTVFAFELENNDSVDVLVTDITIDVATSTNDTIASLIESATLVVDGEETDGDINADGTIDFEDTDFIVGGDDTMDVELRITAAEDADGTVDFSVDADNITAESDDNGDDADVSGSASSETHTISLTGVTLAGTGKESDTNDAGTTGTYELTFEVTAEGDDDVYIYKTAGQSDNDSAPFSSIAASTTGVAYVIYEGGTASTTNFTSDSALLTSGADTSGSYFVVQSGETEEFTLTVTLDPATTAAQIYYIELDAVRFDDNNDTTVGSYDDTLYLVPDDSEFETSAESIS